jgi:nucleoid-associated protein YgaU
MIGSKVIAMIAALVVIVGVAAAGLYVYRQQHEAPPTAGGVARSEGPAPMPEQPKPQAEVKSEAKGPTAVPSFDVVRIEPSGEGVLAGRAEPGWQVNIEDQGAKIASASADAEGAWTVVLEKPLPAGDHSLSLQSVSPDGVRLLASQQSVPVSVGKKEAVAALPAPEEPGITPSEPASANEEATGATPGAAEPQPESAPPAETAAAAPAAEEAQASPPPESAPEGAAQAEPTSEPESSAPATTAQPEPEQIESPPPPAAAEAAPAEPTPARTAQAETPAEPEPVVPPATAEESAAPQSQASPPERRKGPPVRIKTVDFEEQGAGRIVLSGTGDPGAHVLVYLDQQPFGQFIIADDGTWRMEKEGELPLGQHVFNADLIDKTTGIVVGRTSVSVERRPPTSEETKSPEEATPEEPAAKPEAAPPMAEAKPTPAPAEQPAAPQAAASESASPPAAAPATAAAEGAAPQVVTAETNAKPAAKSAHRKRHRPHVYTIRRGDTLWALAERYFGGGWHYVTIYRNNRKHIHNPNRIYPKQKVQIPKH